MVLKLHRLALVQSARPMRACVLWLVLVGLPASVAASQSSPEMADGTLTATDEAATPHTGESVNDDASSASQPSAVGAIIRTVASDFAAFPLRRSTWAIVGLGATGAALVHPFDDTFNSQLAGSAAFFAPGAHVGKAWVQATAAAGLVGVGYLLPPGADGARTNKLTHLGFDLLRAQLMAQVISRATRYSIRRERPTGGCCSLPSGHAINIFAAASVLERHLGMRAGWPALLLASYVGASRLHSDEHFLSDVVLGSAIGLSIGWTIVGRHGRSNYVLQPVAVAHGLMFALTLQ
jgi:membrane-associated phospholipid phosphatase